MAESRGGVRSGILVALLLGAVGASVILPNVWQARQRRRQRVTCGDLRTVMVAAEAYSIDHLTYPEARTMDELARLLEPEYVAHLPRTDAWGHPLDYRCVKKGSEEHIWVRSPGSDGILEHADITAYPGGSVDGFQRDIVYTTFGRSQFPDGTMEP